MAARPRTPAQDAYGSIPAPTPTHLNRGYGSSANENLSSHPMDPSPLAQSVSRPTSGYYDDNFETGSTLQRAPSRTSTLGGTPSRSGTLKKKGSVSRRSSLKRSGSRKSLHAGSIKGMGINDEPGDQSNNSAFYTPIPTSGAPTEILANRFQAWRKFLKDLITYFREIQASYEHRSKALLKVSNVINNTNAPAVFMTEGGLNDANRILRDYHKQAITEANKAREIQNDVVAQLNGLRSDLGQKIKEIKSLSGDFKNNVEKEKEGTRKAVAALEEALAAVDLDPTAVTGKGDPFVVRLAVDRQIERQIDEENYLHRAYLNLEGSGRELESIVTGEIQKAYNALAGILKREADEEYATVERLRSGPISIPKDLEWAQFVYHDPHFVNPDLPLRRIEDIQYPGKTHPAAAEVRAGMLERKSKYLKSYTPGWYVLSPTHLHEFKSADHIYTQAPVMSLYLHDQKLGAHSQPGSSSHKFILKGRQTGTMHRGHSWVFRAETFETMLAWYDDIKSLIEKTGEDRNMYVRKHARSFSSGSMGSESGLEEDEADEIPYAANGSMANDAVVQAQQPQPVRPQPGGRFPSDLQVPSHLQAPLSPSSGSSMNDAQGGDDNSFTRHDDPFVAPVQIPPPAPVAAPVPERRHPPNYGHELPASPISQTTRDQIASAHYHPEPPRHPKIERHDSDYAGWMAPTVSKPGIIAGVGPNQHWQTKRQEAHERLQEQENQKVQVPAVSTLGSDGTTDPSEPSQPSPAVSDATAATTISATSGEPPFGQSIPSEADSSNTERMHLTGHIFPKILRHDTDVSASELHVPGEYPSTVS